MSLVEDKPVRLWRVAAAVAAAVLAVCIAASPGFGQGTVVPTAGVLPPSAKLQGRTYPGWGLDQGDRPPLHGPRTRVR